MGDLGVDEGRLVWAASRISGLDPDEVAARVDVVALAVAVADADRASDLVERAGRLLQAVVRRRPFPASNAAIGWLAAVELLHATQLRVHAEPAAVVALCDAIRAGMDPAEVAATLSSWVVGDGLACPACGRLVYAADPLARRSLPPTGASFELTARCAFEHGAHDRTGRLPAPSLRADRHHPILASGDCGSFLVTGEGGGLVVSPFCDDPPLARVVAVGEVHAGDLVGRWDALVARSRSLGIVPAADAAPDERGRVDLGRLLGALRPGVVGVDALVPAP